MHIISLVDSKPSSIKVRLLRRVLTILIVETYYREWRNKYLPLLSSLF